MKPSAILAAVFWLFVGLLAELGFGQPPETQLWLIGAYLLVGVGAVLGVRRACSWYPLLAALWLFTGLLLMLVFFTPLEIQFWLVGAYSLVACGAVLYIRRAFAWNVLLLWSIPLVFLECLNAMLGLAMACWLSYVAANMPFLVLLMGTAIVLHANRPVRI